MSPLRQRFVEDLRLRNYAESTIESYTYHVGCFAKHCGRSPAELGLAGASGHGQESFLVVL